MLQSDLNGEGCVVWAWMTVCSYCFIPASMWQVNLCRDCKQSEGVITPAATEHRQKTQAGVKCFKSSFHPFCFLRRRWNSIRVKRWVWKFYKNNFMIPAGEIISVKQNWLKKAIKIYNIMTSFHIFGSLIKLNPYNVRLLDTRIIHVCFLSNKIGNVRERRHRKVAHIWPKVTILFIYTQVVTFSKHKIAIYEEFFCIMTVYDGQKKTKKCHKCSLYEL